MQAISKSLRIKSKIDIKMNKHKSKDRKKKKIASNPIVK